MGGLIPVQADEADPRHRDQFPQTVNHAQTGPENRHDCNFLTGDLLQGRNLKRRLHLDILERKVPRHFIAHHQGNLIKQLSEDARRGFLVPHDRQLVLDHGMVDHM